MRGNRPSLTAAAVAATRALESERPPDERICYDPFARLFVSLRFWTFWFRFAEFFFEFSHAEKRGPASMGFVVARERYIDDYLQSCIDGGLEQLVILGAGYDSRAYRFEGLKKVKVFEVDHPATQRVKVARLKEALGALPENVVFVPIDFAKETLERRLYECGYGNRLKTLFIWQGVTEYLTPEAVDNILAFVAHHSANGSSIIFDYMYAPHGEVLMRRLRRITGEERIFGIEKRTIEAFLGQRGFYQVKNVTSEFLKKTYFTGANKRREVASGYGIVSAIVRPHEEEQLFIAMMLGV